MDIGVRFVLERGAWADYLSLATHHYRAARPATVCAVWRLAAEPSDGGPSLLWRHGAYPRLAGVLVVSYPVLWSAARNRATGGRYSTGPNRRLCLRRLNREVRTISRVIIHPVYRGLGLSTRLVAGVLSRLDCGLVEAFARMGAYVPFFRKAGMTEVRLPGRPVYYFARRADHLSPGHRRQRERRLRDERRGTRVEGRVTRVEGRRISATDNCQLTTGL